MDKFKFGLFDVFVYTLPGFIVLASIFLCFIEFNIELRDTIEELFKFVSDLNFYSFLFIVIISYIIGFVFHEFGYKYFVFIGKRIWNKKIINLIKSPLIIEYELTLVRHYSKENFVYIELWYALRGMSFNLSLAFFVLFIVLISKILYCSLFRFDWILMPICYLLFSIVLLGRAIKFHVID